MLASSAVLASLTNASLITYANFLSSELASLTYARFMTCASFLNCASLLSGTNSLCSAMHVPYVSKASTLPSTLRGMR